MAEPHEPALPRLDALDVRRDVLLRADLVQHLQDFFVGPAVQRAGQRGGRGRSCHIRVGLRAGHRAHGIGAAVLLVIRVKDEQHVEGARQDLLAAYFGSTIFHSMFMKFSV